MKKLTLKQILAILLATLTLLLSACTPDEPVVETTTEAPADDTTTTDGDGDETTTAPIDDPDDPDGDDVPTVNSSKDLLTFTPASPDKLVLDEKGNCAPTLIENYNEMAIDDLGRHMVTSEDTGLPKADKWVGIFYSIWTASVGGSARSHTDVTKALASDPENPFYGPHGHFCWWAEPETGYHAADDVWQIRRDMRYLSMLGVDFIFLDFTNGFIYADAFKTLLDTMAEMRAEGQMTPYVTVWLLDGGNMGRLDTEFYNQEKYKDLWFRWEGKPLILLKRRDKKEGTETDRERVPSLYNEDYVSRYTYRVMWSDYNWPADLRPEGVGSNVKYNKWSFNGGWSVNPRQPEVVSVGLAGFAEYGSGRSGPYSAEHYVDDFLETKTMGEGIHFGREYQTAMRDVPDAQVMLVSRWNEWTAQNLGHLDFGFVDQFNPEFSRDIEPMKGGYTDNYFYQFCNMVREFKGVLPAEGNTGAQTMDVATGDFEKWEKIMPVFTDYANDTKWRNFTDPTGEIKYINSSGRHDIVESRLTADGGMVYAYVRCAEKIASYNRNPNWMMLFIDADQNKETGWEGYDFVINYKVLDNMATTICAYKDNVWQEVGIVQYKREGDRMMIAIPRSLLGLTGDQVSVDFHWMDNVTDIYDLHSWFTTGDSAPERRNNYTISLDVPYNASAESVIPGRTEGKVEYMPAVELTSGQKSKLQPGLNQTVYKLPILHNDDGSERPYSKMPEIEKLEENKIVTMPSRGIAANIGFRTSSFALSYDGYIKIPEDGNHRFRIAADDGARLYIDGRLVAEVPYDAEREAGTVVEAGGNIRLAAGYHTFKLEYAEIGNGGAKLALDGDWELYRSSDTGSAEDIDVSYDTSIESVEMDLVTAVSGKPSVGGSHIGGVTRGTVLGLGHWDLALYDAVEIDYCSDANAMMGDIGNFFAISYSADVVSDPAGHDYVLSTGAMSNAEGAWDANIRTATVDLSTVAYKGEIYLAAYMADSNGLRITGIRFIKAKTPTPMPEGGYPPPPAPEVTESVDITNHPDAAYSNAAACYAIVFEGGTAPRRVSSLGELDLSRYAAVRIRYGGDPGIESAGQPIGLLSSADMTQNDTSTPNVLAHGTMVDIEGRLPNDPKYATVIDLTDVTYQGEVFLTLFGFTSHAIQIYSIEFIVAP